MDGDYWTEQSISKVERLQSWRNYVYISCDTRLFKINMFFKSATATHNYFVQPSTDHCTRRGEYCKLSALLYLSIACYKHSSQLHMQNCALSYLQRQERVSPCSIANHTNWHIHSVFYHIIQGVNVSLTKSTSSCFFFWYIWIVIYMIFKNWYSNKKNKKKRENNSWAFKLWDLGPPKCLEYQR